MTKKTGEAGDPVIIKKYANRRLYNTGTSSYITLDDLAAMVRDNVEFQVIDAKSGADLTHTILTQIIMEEESNGEQMLPVSFLRQLIAMYGNSMQAMMPPYLEAAMANFQTNQTSLQEAFQANMGTDAFARMAENNMAMFKAATSAFMPGALASTPEKRPTEGESDIETLRRQMAEMQSKLDKLSK